MEKFLFNLSLLIIGMIIIRFGIIQLKKRKEGKSQIKKSLFSNVFLSIFFLLILGMIVYSVLSYFAK
mgnify:CR=1 FL=1